MPQSLRTLLAVRPAPRSGPGGAEANNPNRPHTLQRFPEITLPRTTTYERLARIGEHIYHRKNVATRNAAIIKSPYSMWSCTDLNSATFSCFGSVSCITIRS